jgi:hypothetical protein
LDVKGILILKIMYRIGRKENILGTSWYVLEKKVWWGWKTITTGSKGSIIDTTNQLKENGEIVINVNIKV